HPLERADLAPKPRREDLFELRERAQGRLLEAGHRAARRRPQPDRHGDRLVVLQQEWREGCAGLQSIAADGTAGRMDRVPERPQPLDVVADRAGADLEAFSELRPGPVAGRLEQREQAEQSTRRSHLDPKSTTALGT